MNAPLVKLEGLKKYFPVRSDKLFSEKEWIKAVDGVYLEIQPGEVIGLVGESGCGKSTLVNLLLRLEEATEGKIWFDETDLTHLSQEALRKTRRDIQMVFQDPFWSLNPRLLVRDIVGEPLTVYLKLSQTQLVEKVQSLLEMVGLPRESLYHYPHEFSSGQRQRIAIARALALEPRLVVLDEPTSAIDILSQAQILDLLMQIKRNLGLTYILISHDLSVVHYLSDRIVVMYLGKVVEEGEADTIFNSPRHPYTQALLNAIPDITKYSLDDLQTLEGSVPSAINPPSGCRFHTRCPMAMEVCRREEPVMLKLGNSHRAACHLLQSNNPKAKRGIP
ncbi:MAG: ATP-binding cassette domain-containing protein [Chloroflexi bacterium]|nr:ATP-binding cassette domain-containing protein [Chloroflexota bacterium]